jgi:hypothetical protein
MKSRSLALITALIVFIGLLPCSFAASWWEPFAQDLYDKNIVNSAEENKFRPNDPVNRAELAKMINLSSFQITDPFDVTDPGFDDVHFGDWVYTDVAALQNVDIIRGISENEFQPEGFVTRAAAMKMVALTFELEDNGEPIPFDDVNDTDWFYSHVAAAYQNGIVAGTSPDTFEPGASLTRAAMAKIISKTLEATGRSDSFTIKPTLTVQTTEGVPEVLRISVASDSPTYNAIPVNAFNLDMAHFSFANEGDEEIFITSITLTRMGFGDPSHFESLRLYKGNQQVGVDKRFSSQDQTAMFNFGRNPVEVLPGSSVILRVVADLDLPGPGFSNSIGIKSADDVSATTLSGDPVTINGTFPSFGNNLTSSGASVSDLEYTVIDPHGTTPTEYGLRSSNQLLTRIILMPKADDAELVSITFWNAGSTNDSDVADLNLYKDGYRVAGPAQQNNRFVTFSLHSEPLLIKKDIGVTLTLKGSFPGGFRRTVGYDIYRDFHIEALTQEFGYAARVSESDDSQAIIVDTIY